MKLEQFRAAYLTPARASCERVRKEIAEAAAEYERLVSAREFDDAAAAAVQARLVALGLDLQRWERRYSHLTSLESVQQGGRVLL